MREEHLEEGTFLGREHFGGENFLKGEHLGKSTFLRGQHFEQSTHPGKMEKHTRKTLLDEKHFSEGIALRCHSHIT